jgi:coenzyme F420-reducing hydrogenase gamma subunit
MKNGHKPRLAVFKFASCDGCQLSLLDCEEELLAIAGAIEIAYFVEASSKMMSGPYDVTLVEGSVTTDEEIERIKDVRRQSRFLVSIGACATSGGIQALKNWADVDDYIDAVYANPEYIDTLKTSRPISDYVPVDFALRGCPISKFQLLELVTSLLIGRMPRVPSHSVCLECKLKGTVCVMVAEGEPCLGPATQAGCGALCPSYGRGCYGCFGPADTANPIALGNHFLELGLNRNQVSRSFRGFNGYYPAFRTASEQFEE